MGISGLDYLQNAARPRQLPIVTELMDVRMLEVFLEYDVDVIQIGARNMQNFDLLKEVGKVNKPVILKRGLSATLSEWLMAAECATPRAATTILFLRARHPHLRNRLPQCAGHHRHPGAEAGNPPCR